MKRKESVNINSANDDESRDSVINPITPMLKHTIIDFVGEIVIKIVYDPK